MTWKKRNKREFKNLRNRSELRWSPLKLQNITTPPPQKKERLKERDHFMAITLDLFHEFSAIFIKILA